MYHKFTTHLGLLYHKSDEVKEFLASVNDQNEPENRAIHCILFAPTSPEQNPVEDVWLQAKNFVRKYWRLCKSFKVVKWLFKFFINNKKYSSYVNLCSTCRNFFIHNFNLL